MPRLEPSAVVRHRREAGLTAIGLAATALAIVMLVQHVSTVVGRSWGDDGPWTDVRVGLFVVATTALLYGVVVYQLSRLGSSLRRSRHTPPPYEELLGNEADRCLPSVVVLVPSYKEDPRTIRQTLLSAALQDYPIRRVVLLVDDPPYPTSSADAALLRKARGLPSELTNLMAAKREEIERAAAASARRRETTFDAQVEVHHLLRTYTAVDGWFAAQAAGGARRDHTDVLFTDLTYTAHRELLRPAAQELIQALGHLQIAPDEIQRHYQRLIAQFRVEITCFERKRYANLSHEPNKAANLNSYLDLIGRSVRERRGPDGVHLVACGPEDTDAVSVPDASYVITLDADSLLSPDYARRLVHIMETPGNERLAVAQTPYTAIPGASGAVERIAGAPTDIQYLVHQGFTHFGATFWVGANALLRKTALDDIRVEGEERGYRVSRFIQDRTVIEDTESTVDLIARGWQLHNEPERLAYSATPPDFGALLVQRQRWANGGLLILPKLLRYAVRRRWSWTRPVELFIRAHYLGSLALSSFALLVLLFLPTEEAFMSPWLPLAGLPYLLLYWRDLLQAGYRRTDILRVYAFNWLLLPINVAGVLKSLQQAKTGRKIPFGRTPKVIGRTAMPAWASAAEWLLFLFAVNAVVWELNAGRWYHAVFAGSTAVAFGYALVTFMGVRESLEDLRSGTTRAVRRLVFLLAVDRSGSRGYGG